MAEILVVGWGNMGEALGNAWKAAHHHVLGVNPGIEGCYQSPSDLPSDFTPQTIIFAVKPQGLREVLPLYQRYQNQGILFVSVAAGVESRFYHDFLPQEKIVRAMPNLGARYKASMTGLYTPTDLSPTHLLLLENLFGTVGKWIWVKDEKHLDIVTALSGSGPAYFYQMVEDLVSAGVREGLNPEEALTCAKMALIGAAKTLENSADLPSTLRDQVTSPGGVTAKALEVLNSSTTSLNDLMHQAVTANIQHSTTLRTTS